MDTAQKAQKASFSFAKVALRKQTVQNIPKTIFLLIPHRKKKT